MDGQAVTTLISAIGLLIGMYTITNRSEDRMGKRIDDVNKRIDDVKETLRAEIKAASATIETKITQAENRLSERIEARIVRG